MAYHDIEYNRSVIRLTNHALLHLHFHIHYSERVVPTKARNALIVKWLKARVKSPNYKLVKQEIKALINTARQPNKDVEHALWNLHAVNVNYTKKLSDLDHFYIYLEDLKHILGCPVTLEDNTTEFSEGTLYMKKSSINNAFNEDNHQVAAMELMTISSQPRAVLSSISSLASFHTITLKRSDGNRHYYSIELNQNNVEPLRLSA